MIKHRAKRTDPDLRRAQFLQAGMKVAAREGFNAFTVTSVGREVNCSRQLVNRYFKDRDGLKKAVVLHALKVGDQRVIGQAVLSGHPAVRRLSEQEKSLALKALAQ